MNLTVDALKELYIALGGNATNVANITLTPDMIKAIAAFISGGGTKELPTVTNTDNGKVLTVSGGKWAAATPTNQLPTVTIADSDKVLTVVNDHWEAVTPVSQLPAVTATENGEVLTVVEGAWAAAALPT